MKSSYVTSQARQHLDAVYKDIRPIGRQRPPVRGWIRTVREALGMSSAQLAKRMGIRQPTVSEMEQSELRGTIQLETLRRAAQAMDCTVVYALVPNRSLEITLHEQARRVAARRLRPIEHSMLLEQQEVPRKAFKKRLDALASEVNPRTLWNET